MTDTVIGRFEGDGSGVAELYGNLPTMGAVR
jgi:hypothetical protein